MDNAQFMNNARSLLPAYALTAEEEQEQQRKLEAAKHRREPRTAKSAAPSSPSKLGLSSPPLHEGVAYRKIHTAPLLRHSPSASHMNTIVNSVASTSRVPATPGTATSQALAPTTTTTTTITTTSSSSHSTRPSTTTGYEADSKTTTKTNNNESDLANIIRVPLPKGATSPKGSDAAWLDNILPDERRDVVPRSASKFASTIALPPPDEYKFSWAIPALDAAQSGKPNGMPLWHKEKNFALTDIDTTATTTTSANKGLAHSFSTPLLTNNQEEPKAHSSLTYASTTLKVHHKKLPSRFHRATTPQPEPGSKRLEAWRRNITRRPPSTGGVYTPEHRQNFTATTAW
jgi:hypothetical protein